VAVSPNRRLRLGALVRAPSHLALAVF